MSTFSPKLLLLDIEGTTSSIAFVHEVLFPFARREMARYLAENAAAPAVLDTLEVVAQDAGGGSFAAWCPHPWPGAPAREWVVAHLHRLMDADAKQTGLKRLQGFIWQAGYDGTLHSHVYPDVTPKLREWSQAGLTLAIYSSGSSAAQKLYFAHTEEGDLTPLLSGYYDTTYGSKRVAESYRAIAAACGVPAGDMLFLSDVPEELDAAREAGLATVLVERPGNRPAPGATHPRITSFEALDLRA